MAKVSGKGQQYLAVAGGLALFLVAWRFDVPTFVGGRTTLLSAIAIMLGILVGWRQGAMIAGVYVLALIIGLPQALWGGHSGEPFFVNPHSGLSIGLVAAAIAAGKVAPSAHAGYAKLILAILAGHAAYLACGFAWVVALKFGTPASALQAIVVPQLIPVATKSVLCFALGTVAAKVIK